VKPVDLDQFMSVVQAIKSFWLGVVLLPPRYEQPSAKPADSRKIPRAGFAPDWHAGRAGPEAGSK
jgi:hypothetical protein